MALTVNTNIINDTDQYLLDAKNVKGTYVVVSTIGERDNLPTVTIIEGSLCYVTGTSDAPVNKFYQYDGTTWQESKLNHEAAKVTYATRDQVLEILTNYGFIASDFNDVTLSENNALTFSILPMLKDDGNLLIYPLPVLENERLTF